VLQWKCTGVPLPPTPLLRLQQHCDPFTDFVCPSHRLLTRTLHDPLVTCCAVQVEAFIFDCDGVIWRGEKLIDGVPETLEMLRAAGKKMIFVTNNSTKSRSGYKSKFTGLGLEVDAGEIYSSSYAAAAFLHSTNFDKEKKVYIIGEVGIQEELDKLGIMHIGGPKDNGKAPSMGKGDKLEQDPDVAAVVVGFDRNINYYKIQYATLCIRENPGCQFIATNLDAVTHLTDAQEWAGNGAMVRTPTSCRCHALLNPCILPAADTHFTDQSAVSLGAMTAPTSCPSCRSALSKAAPSVNRQSSASQTASCCATSLAASTCSPTRSAWLGTG
jgi:phosphoglycolate/pyridoxal phosphate phosphatase family enzyme